MKSAIIRTGFDTLYYSGAHRLLRPFFEGVGAIFMLHHVREPRRDAFQPNRLLEVSPEFLEETIIWLRSQNIDIVALDEMHRRLIERDFARRFVCITFDDGYRDNKAVAYPILKRHGVPFTIYVPTSFPDRQGKLWWLALEQVIATSKHITVTIDGKEREIDCVNPGEKRDAYDTVYWWLRGRDTETEIHAFVDELAARHRVDVAPSADELCMTWDEIRELAADPTVTIGAHTINHVMLGKWDDEAARRELKESRERLEAELGMPVRHLAYPYGGRDLVGPREFRLASEIGYKTAVTTRPGVLFPEHRGHLTALPRLSLNGEYQAARYVKVLMSGTATALFNGFRRVDAA